MSRNRVLLQASLVIGAVGLLVVGALSVLSEDEDPTPDSGDQPDATEVASADEMLPLAMSQMSDAEKSRARHNNPWPFADFADDISSLLRPGRQEVMRTRDQVETAIYDQMQEHTFTIRMDNARVGDVVARLRLEFEPFKIDVYEGSPKVPDHVVFERIYLTNVNIQQVIGFLSVSSDEHVFSTVTPAGICIGSKNATVQAHLDAKKWEAGVRSRLREDPDTFLDVDYRPDMKGASLGRLVRDIRTKTGVEVVIGPRAWETGVVFTWVADPLPLRDALDEIADRLGGHVFVKDDRAFILVN